MARHFADKMDAKIKWAEANAEPLALAQPDQTMPTVKATYRIGLDVCEGSLQAGTYRGYNRAVDKHLVPGFGNATLHLLKREDVKRLIATLAKKEGKSKGTIQNCLVPLEAAYNVAIEDGLVTF